MKKILSLISVCIIFISMVASVSPEIESKIKNISGEDQYTTSIIPLPRDIQLQDNYAKSNLNDNNLINSDNRSQISLEIKKIQFID